MHPYGGTCAVSHPGGSCLSRHRATHRPWQVQRAPAVRHHSSRRADTGSRAGSHTHTNTHTGRWSQVRRVAARGAQPTGPARRARLLVRSARPAMCGSALLSQGSAPPGCAVPQAAPRPTWRTATASASCWTRRTRSGRTRIRPNGALAASGAAASASSRAWRGTTPASRAARTPPPRPVEHPRAASTAGPLPSTREQPGAHTWTAWCHSARPLSSMHA